MIMMRIYRSKRGDWILTVIVAIIISSIIGIISFILLRDFYESSGYESMLELCRMSTAYLVAGTKPKIGDSPVAFHCPFTTFIISDDKIERLIEFDGKIKSLKRPLEGSAAEDREEINQEIAKAAVDCWYMFHAGELDIFGNLEGDNRCIPCAEIRFTDDYTGGDLSNLGSFMASEGSGYNGMTYLQYLTKGQRLDKGVEQTFARSVNQLGNLINPAKGKEFRVVFLYAKDSMLKDLLIEGGGAAATCAIVFGAAGAKIGAVAAPFTGPLASLASAGVGALLGGGGCLVVAVIDVVSEEEEPRVMAVAIVPAYYDIKAEKGENVLVTVDEICDRFY